MTGWSASTTRATSRRNWPTSWDVSADAKEVTYHLRPDAHFSDGTPVTAKDVVFSFERLLKINQGPANLFADVLKPGAVVAVDDHTVKFTLEQDLRAVPHHRAGRLHRQFEAGGGQRGHR